MKISSRTANWVATVVGVCAAIVYWFPPSENSFYPQCLFARLTGWECPGCGSTRALYALLHLHFADAMALNPLFTVAFFPLVAWALLQYVSIIRNGRTFEMTLPRAVYPVLVAVALAFGLLRNLSLGGLR